VADAFLQAVSFDCEGWMPDDNYFHLGPRREKRVLFSPIGPPAAFRAEVHALNLADFVPARLDAPARAGD
jgi:hypothetical protein